MGQGSAVLHACLFVRLLYPKCHPLMRKGAASATSRSSVPSPRVIVASLLVLCVSSLRVALVVRNGRCIVAGLLHVVNRYQRPPGKRSTGSTAHNRVYVGESPTVQRGILSPDNGDCVGYSKTSLSGCRSPISDFRFPISDLRSQIDLR